MNHDRRDDRTPATRCATGIMPVAASPSNAPPTPTPSASGGGFANVRRRSSVQVNCRTERRRALKKILERTAMVVEMVVKNRRAGRPRPEVVHQPEPCLSVTVQLVAGIQTLPLV